MSEDDKSLDLTGIGKFAKAVPAASWDRLVKTACDTFSQLIEPNSYDLWPWETDSSKV